MASSTLSLGSSAYELLEALDPSKSSDDAKIRDRGNGNVDLLSATNGALIGDSTATGNGIGIQAAALSNGMDVKVFGASDELKFTAADVVADGTESGSDAAADKVRLFGNAEKLELQTGGGADNIAALRDATNAKISTGSGDDTLRIGGKADGSLISTGTGDDNILVGRASDGIDIVAGAGDDTVTFNNKFTTSGTLRTESYDDGTGGTATTQFSNLIDLGAGNDQLTARDGIEATGVARYRVAAGEGNDTITFGANSDSEGVDLLTQAGSDSIVLGQSITDSTINFGADTNSSNLGDTLVLGSGGSMINTTITSGNAGGDSLVMGGYVSYDNSTFTSQFGSGADNIDFSNGTADFAGSLWNLGGGNDTLTLNGSSIINANFALGGGSNTVYANSAAFFDGVVISDFGADDVLIIGTATIAFADRNDTDVTGLYGITFNS